MKRMLTIAVAAVLLLSLAACGQNAPKQTAAEPTAMPTAEPVAEPVAITTAEPEAEPLSTQYARWLREGTYYYRMTTTTQLYVIDITVAAKDGMYCARMGSNEQYIRQMVIDGRGYAAREWTGEMGEFEPASEADVLPDFSALTFQSTKTEGAKTVDTYTYRMMDGKEREHLFVFENGKLTEMTTPEVIIEGTWPVSEFTNHPPDEMFVIPQKTALTVAEIAEGVYTGTLSGDSYTTGDDDGIYTITPDIPPSELTVTVRGGQVELYCAATIDAAGEIRGVQTPRSPTYTQTVSGALALNQIDSRTVRAEGDLVAPGEGLWIYWDNNMKFERWEVVKKDQTYHCVVTITMAGGVPTAELAIDGSETHRTATVPLALAAQSE